MARSTIQRRSVRAFRPNDSAARCYAVGLRQRLRCHCAMSLTCERRIPFARYAAQPLPVGRLLSPSYARPFRPFRRVPSGGSALARCAGRMPLPRGKVGRDALNTNRIPAFRSLRVRACVISRRCSLPVPNRRTLRSVSQSLISKSGPRRVDLAHASAAGFRVGQGMAFSVLGTLSV
jgi:hypothetical protein